MEWVIQPRSDHQLMAGRRLRTTLDDGTDLTLTVSIGVASLRPEDESIDDVLSRADEALYQVKQSRRNCLATA